MKLMRTGWLIVTHAMVVGVACLYCMVGIAQVTDPTRDGPKGSKDDNAASKTPTDVPGVDIQINVLDSDPTDDEKDDYICVANAPGLPKTRCRAKLVKASPTDVTVDLKDEPGGGEVRFPEEANMTKTITLNSNGVTWTEFYISGKKESVLKDDAKIAAYKTGTTTTKLGQQDLTVYKVEIAFADPDDSNWADLIEKKVILCYKNTRIKLKLEVVIFAACSVLDINDYNGNFSDGKSPGEEWAQTGVKLLLGYNAPSPSDGTSAPAIIADVLSSCSGNIGANILTLRAWCSANYAANAGNACAIYNGNIATNGRYFYFKRRGVIGFRTYHWSSVSQASW